VPRYLVLGDPVVALGPAALIQDGALIIDGPEITDVGPREVLAARGPFDRVLGSADHFVMPGFVNCHYHSELAIGPGLYQHIFEKANVYIQGAVGPIAEEDLYHGILWGLITAIKGSLEPGKWADLLVVRKDRILFPPGRYDGEPFLDVVVDRADAGDIDLVLGHGRVLMENGRVTIVDEDRVRDRFAAAVRDRVYRPPAEVRRWAELGTLVEPYLAPLYQPWYDEPVEPAHVYNARRAGPGGGGGAGVPGAD
jgi:cytosine/adenosine deaminase-related metal-dependent hydrolase